MKSTNGKPKKKSRLSLLLQERAHLGRKLANLEARISEARQAAVSADAIDRWLDELTEGLPDLPALPTDFSRADIYDDHD